MKRSVWKLPFVNPALMKLKNFNDDSQKTKILWFRNSVIPSFMVGRRVRVYNGAWYLVQTISSDMVGSKFGEYSLTKRSDSQLQSRMKAKKKLKNVNGSFN